MTIRCSPFPASRTKKIQLDLKRPEVYWTSEDLVRFIYASSGHNVMLFGEIGRNDINRLNAIYDQIRLVRNPRKRRSFVDSFYARFVHKRPAEMADSREAEPLMKILGWGGKHYRRHLFNVSHALTGTAYFANGKRTNRQIALLERERAFRSKP